MLHGEAVAFLIEQGKLHIKPNGTPGPVVLEQRPLIFPSLAIPEDRPPRMNEPGQQSPDPNSAFAIREDGVKERIEWPVLVDATSEESAIAPPMKDHPA
jgi:hypothetical protein